MYRLFLLYFAHFLHARKMVALYYNEFLSVYSPIQLCSLPYSKASMNIHKQKF